MRRGSATTAAAVLIMLLGLAGCGGGEGDMSGMDSKPEMVGPEAPTSTTVDEKPREIIRNADIAVRVPDVRTAASQANTIAAEAGGRTAAQSITTQAEAVYADLTLRVPTESLDPVLAQLAELGDVQSLNITTEDVTTQAVDLDARINALQASVDRLEELLTQATSAQALVEIERELSARQAELDSLVAQRAALSDAVALSSIYVSLSPESEAAAFAPPGFLSGLESGWNALRTLVAVIITAAGFLLPFIIALAIIAVPITVIVMALSRRRRR